MIGFALLTLYPPIEPNSLFVLIVCKFYWIVKFTVVGKSRFTAHMKKETGDDDYNSFMNSNVTMT